MYVKRISKLLRFIARTQLSIYWLQLSCLWSKSARAKWDVSRDRWRRVEYQIGVDLADPKNPSTTTVFRKTEAGWNPYPDSLVGKRDAAVIRGDSKEREGFLRFLLGVFEPHGVRNRLRDMARDRKKRRGK